MTTSLNAAKNQMPLKYSKTRISKRDRLEAIVLVLIILIGIQFLPGATSQSQSHPSQGLTR
jgi:hypothetical protein